MEISSYYCEQFKKMSKYVKSKAVHLKKLQLAVTDNFIYFLYAVISIKYNVQEHDTMSCHHHGF